MSFNVQSLFTNVRLNQTINITLSKIYSYKEIATDISQCEMKEMLYLCTKNVRFFYNSIYTYNPGIAVGSPLDPIVENMAELDMPVLPCLATRLSNWRRLVDNTICFIKADLIRYVFSKLKGFHRNIQFNTEGEKKGRMSFLDIITTLTQENIINNNTYIR